MDKHKLNLDPKQWNFTTSDTEKMTFYDRRKYKNI